MIADPLGQRFYPGKRNDRMPAFATDGTREEHNTHSRRQLELLVDWLRGTWFRPPR